MSDAVELLRVLDLYAEMDDDLREQLAFVLDGNFDACSDIALSKSEKFLIELAPHIADNQWMLYLIDDIEWYLDNIDDDDELE